MAFGLYNWFYYYWAYIVLCEIARLSWVRCRVGVCGYGVFPCAMCQTPLCLYVRRKTAAPGVMSPAEIFCWTVEMLNAFFNRLLCIIEYISGERWRAWNEQHPGLFGSRSRGVFDIIVNCWDLTETKRCLYSSPSHNDIWIQMDDTCSVALIVVYRTVCVEEDVRPELV